MTKHKMLISDPKEMQLVNNFRAQQNYEAMDFPTLVQNPLLIIAEDEEFWTPLGLQTTGSERAKPADEAVQPDMLTIHDFLI